MSPNNKAMTTLLQCTEADLRDVKKAVKNAMQNTKYNGKPIISMYPSDYPSADVLDDMWQNLAAKGKVGRILSEERYKSKGKSKPRNFQTQLSLVKRKIQNDLINGRLRYEKKRSSGLATGAEAEISDHQPGSDNEEVEDEETAASPSGRSLRKQGGAASNPWTLSSDDDDESDGDSEDDASDKDESFRDNSTIPVQSARKLTRRTMHGLPAPLAQPRAREDELVASTSSSSPRDRAERASKRRKLFDEDAEESDEAIVYENVASSSIPGSRRREKMPDRSFLSIQWEASLGAAQGERMASVSVKAFAAGTKSDSRLKTTPEKSADQLSKFKRAAELKSTVEVHDSPEPPKKMPMLPASVSRSVEVDGVMANEAGPSSASARLEPSEAVADRGNDNDVEMATAPDIPEPEAADMLQGPPAKDQVESTSTTASAKSSDKAQQHPITDTATAHAIQSPEQRSRSGTPVAQALGSTNAPSKLTPRSADRSANKQPPSNKTSQAQIQQLAADAGVDIFPEPIDYEEPLFGEIVDPPNVRLARILLNPQPEPSKEQIQGVFWRAVRTMASEEGKETARLRRQYARLEEQIDRLIGQNVELVEENARVKEEIVWLKAEGRREGAGRGE